MPGGAPEDPVIRVEQLGAGAHVVELIGDHGYHNAAEIAKALESAQRNEGFVLLDLSAATFIDSSVLREIFLADGRGRHDGHAFCVQVVRGGNIERVLQLTRLDQVVAVRHSRDEALAPTEPARGE